MHNMQTAQPLQLPSTFLQHDFGVMLIRLALLGASVSPHRTPMRQLLSSIAIGMRWQKNTNILQTLADLGVFGRAYSRGGRGRCPVRWLSCSTTTRKGGYQQRSSRSHCRSTVAGHTTMDGRKRREWCRPARKAATCAPKTGLGSACMRRPDTPDTCGCMQNCRKTELQSYKSAVYMRVAGFGKQSGRWESRKALHGARTNTHPAFNTYSLLRGT